MVTRSGATAGDYDAACHVTLRELAGQTFDGLAVVTSTGMGDGCYPVYATVVHGRVTRVEVVFVGDEEGV